MAPLALYARWFPPERFSTFAGIQLGLGSLGALLRDRAARLRHRELRLARRRFSASASAPVLIGVLIWLIVTRRSARRDIDAAHGDAARKRRRHLAGDPHAVDRPRLRGAARELFELRAGRRVSGAGRISPTSTATTSRRAATSCSSRRWRRSSARSSGGRCDRLFGSYKLPVLIGAGTDCRRAGLLALRRHAAAVTLLLSGSRCSAFRPASTSVVMAHGRSLVPPHLLGRGHHAAQHRHHGRRVPGRSSSAAPSSTCFRSRDGAYPLEAYRLVFGLQAVLVLIGFVWFISAAAGRAPLGRGL